MLQARYYDDIRDDSMSDALPSLTVYDLPCLNLVTYDVSVIQRRLSPTMSRLIPHLAEGLEVDIVT